MRQIYLTHKNIIIRAAIVDNNDFDWLNQWEWHTYATGKKKNYWRVVGMSNKSMARVIMQAPKHLHVHHIDGNPLNNQRKNLLLVTHSQHRSYHKYRYR